MGFIMIDMVGQKFGRLTVESRVSQYRKERGDKGTYWLCKCECGKERVVSRQSLISKNTRSCGCLQKDIVSKLNFNDISGQKFGKLTAQKFIGNGHWICKCDCGEEKITTISCLNAGMVKSCGCLQKELGRKRVLPNAKASFNKLLGMYKNKSKKRGHKFLLTEEEFSNLTKGDCFYCGCSPQQESKCKENSAPYLYNGIDRIDSNGSYEKDNCVSCCKKCNYAKREMSTLEFKSWLKIVYERFVLGENKKG